MVDGDGERRARDAHRRIPGALDLSVLVLRHRWHLGRHWK
jgi:hypothetical protein